MPPKKKAAKKAAAAPPKSSMEESAAALAGVDGALGRGKGKAAAKASGAKDMTRSESMDKLAEVAGTLLKDQAVPDPIAAAAAAAAAAPAAVPTGFRKKGGGAAKAPAAAAAAAKPSDNPPADGKPKKTQITYNPDVPMSKEQLTAWRREMRRVRNRESAAASRRKVRDRIEELEEEVEVWKRRYEEVMSRLGKAEGGGKKKRAKKGGDDEVAV